MKTAILLAHPNLKDSKINKALIQSIKNDTNITIHNLYDTYPNKAIDAIKEIEILKSHQRIVFQFPLFWFSSPSLLKEWQDVVFSQILYGKEPKILSDKTFQIITSAGSPEEKYQADGRNQKNLEEILLPFTLSASYLKMQVKPTFCVYNAMGMTQALLDKAIENYKKALQE